MTRVLDLFFIAIIIVIACFGAVLMLASSTNPTLHSDTFSNPVNAQTKTSADLVTNVVSNESGGEGLFIVFCAVAVIAVIAFAFIYHFRKGGLGGGRWRTG